MLIWRVLLRIISLFKSLFQANRPSGNSPTNNQAIHPFNPLNMNKITETNQHITNLITALHSEQEKDTANIHTFVPGLIEYAEQRQSQIMQAIEVLNLPDVEVQQTKAEISEKLGKFTANIRSALNMGDHSANTDWATADQYMKDTDYYKQFFIGLDGLDEALLTWIDQNPQTSIKVADGKTMYEQWLALEELDAKHSELYENYQKLIDLQAVSMASLRVYGLSQREIRDIAGI